MELEHNYDKSFTNTRKLPQYFSEVNTSNTIYLKNKSEKRKRVVNGLLKTSPVVISLMLAITALIKSCSQTQHLLPLDTDISSIPIPQHIPLIYTNDTTESDRRREHADDSCPFSYRLSEYIILTVCKGDEVNLEIRQIYLTILSTFIAIMKCRTVKCTVNQNSRTFSK